jgi:hypothetical protein
MATYFRKLFSRGYLGIELEMNQRDYFENKPRWRLLCAAVIESLQRTVFPIDSIPRATQAPAPRAPKT